MMPAEPAPAGPELPLSVVRRIAARAAPKPARFSPEAVEALARIAEASVRVAAGLARDTASARGRRTVYGEDVPGDAPAQAAPERKRPLAGDLAATALARANLRLKARGEPPELLGGRSA